MRSIRERPSHSTCGEGAALAPERTHGIAEILDGLAGEGPGVWTLLAKPLKEGSSLGHLQLIPEHREFIVRRLRFLQRRKPWRCDPRVITELRSPGPAAVERHQGVRPRIPAAGLHGGKYPSPGATWVPKLVTAKRPGASLR